MRYRSITSNKAVRFAIKVEAQSEPYWQDFDLRSCWVPRIPSGSSHLLILGYSMPVWLTDNRVVP